jgi:hypothetical protein
MAKGALESSGIASIIQADTAGGMRPRMVRRWISHFG